MLQLLELSEYVTEVLCNNTNNVSNPNYAPNPIQNNNNQSDVKKNYNRAYATRRDTDKEKNFTVTLLDIDTAIINTLNTFSIIFP